MSENLNHIGFYLKQIFHEQKVGLLFFQHGDINKYLFFQNGELVHARSNNPQEYIGQILFKLGKISGKAYTQINELIEPKRNIGEVMIENQLISKENLADGLNYQMREIVQNIFPHFSGEFRFQQKEALADEDVDVSISIPNLIEDGIRSMPFDSRLQSFFESNLLVSKEKTFQNRLVKNEKGVYKAINETAPVAATRLSSGFEPEFFWKCLYLLYCLGLIDLRAEARDEDKKTKSKAKSTRKVDKRLEDVLNINEQLAALNYYEALGVPREASPSEIKKAYFKLARDYHPDTFERDLSEEMKKKIDDVFDFINKSYQTLSHEVRKDEYDKVIDTPKVSTPKEVQKNAEIRFRKSKTLFDQTRYNEAMVLLEEAVRMNPNKSSYFLLLALTQTKIKTYHKQAIKNFEKAIELNPWSPDGYLGLGMLYKSEGMSVLSAKQFKKALEIDPGNRGALKELGKVGGKTKKLSLKDLLSSDLSSLLKKRK